MSESAIGQATAHPLHLSFLETREETSNAKSDHSQLILIFAMDRQLSRLHCKKTLHSFTLLDFCESLLACRDLGPLFLCCIRHLGNTGGMGIHESHWARGATDYLAGRDGMLRTRDNPIDARMV